MSSSAISATDPYQRRRIPVLDTDMAYIDSGQGEPVIFLLCCSWPHQEEVTVKGIHFMQEDSPAEIGEAISGFIERIS